MTRVIFKFDKKRDLFNLWQTCSAESYGRSFAARMPKEMLAYCERKSYTRCKQFILKYYRQLYSSGQIELFVDAANKSWKLIGNEYFRRLKRITGKPLNVEIIYAYPTLASRCPYDPKRHSFMVSFFANASNVLEIAGHEIMHLHFHEHYFSDVEKKVGNAKAHDIKEALTVLLNEEFSDLWWVGDEGYESHKKLREFIAKEWRKDKNFDKLVEKCVRFVKRGK